MQGRKAVGISGIAESDWKVFWIALSLMIEFLSEMNIKFTSKIYSSHCINDTAAVSCQEISDEEMYGRWRPKIVISQSSPTNIWHAFTYSLPAGTLRLLNANSPV
jgi:hypothetical protein